MLQSEEHKSSSSPGEVKYLGITSHLDIRVGGVPIHPTRPHHGSAPLWILDHAHLSQHSRL